MDDPWPTVSPTATLQALAGDLQTALVRAVEFRFILRQQPHDLGKIAASHCGP